MVIRILIRLTVRQLVLYFPNKFSFNTVFADTCSTVCRYRYSTKATYVFLSISLLLDPDPGESNQSVRIPADLDPKHCSNFDPDSVESLDPYPDPDSQSGSGSKGAKWPRKIENSS